jgi:hypothetical protein
MIILWYTARQRLGKHARNTHMTNNTTEEVFQCGPHRECLLDNWVVRHLYNNRKHVFSVGSCPRLLNESLYNIGESSISIGERVSSR